MQNYGTCKILAAGITSFHVPFLSDHKNLSHTSKMLQYSLLAEKKKGKARASLQASSTSSANILYIFQVIRAAKMSKAI